VIAQAFLESFIQWAKSQSDISAVALVGSHARNAATNDSDIDLVILTSRVNDYLHDRSWLTAFGDIKNYREEHYGKVTSLRVFYDDGLEVEYGFATPDWAETPIDEGTLRVLKEGMRVLHDPLGVLARMQQELLAGQ
jgi:predicted nucleotidyltransferase